MSVYAQFRMFARCPALSIQPATTAVAVDCPAAMFSAIAPPEYPAALMRSANERPSWLSCEK